jgi:hypothetical protein
MGGDEPRDLLPGLLDRIIDLAILDGVSQVKTEDKTSEAHQQHAEQGKHQGELPYEGAAREPLPNTPEPSCWDEALLC